MLVQFCSSDILKHFFFLFFFNFSEDYDLDLFLLFSSISFAILGLVFSPCTLHSKIQLYVLFVDSVSNNPFSLLSSIISTPNMYHQCHIGNPYTSLLPYYFLYHKTSMISGIIYIKFQVLLPNISPHP